MQNVMAVFSSTTCCNCVVFASFVTHVEHGPHRLAPCSIPSSCTYPHPMVSITQFAQHTYKKRPCTCQLHMSTYVAVTLPRNPKKYPSLHTPTEATPSLRPVPRSQSPGQPLCSATAHAAAKGQAQTPQGKAYTPAQGKAQTPPQGKALAPPGQGPDPPGQGHRPPRHANHARPGPSQGQGQSPDLQTMECRSALWV